LDEISVIIRGDASEAVAAINSVMGALEKFAGNSMSAIGAAFSKVFDIANAAREAAGAVGILGGVFEAVGVKAAATFESSLAKIQGLALNSKTAAQDHRYRQRPVVGSGNESTRSPLRSFQTPTTISFQPVCKSQTLSLSYSVPRWRQRPVTPISQEF